MVALTSPWSATSKASSVVGTAANCIGAVGRTCSAALPLPASAACADLVGAVLHVLALPMLAWFALLRFEGGIERT